MASSKVILVGAISIVFGLYSLSLIRVGSLIGNNVATNSYIQRASLNARAGMQRAMHRWITGNFESSVGPNPVGDSSSFRVALSTYSYTCSTSPYNITWLKDPLNYNSGDSIRLTVVSHGVYKVWGEPTSFPGHEVIRTAYFVFKNTDYPYYGHWYDVTFKMAFDSVNYGRENQLDASQQYKGN